MSAVISIYLHVKIMNVQVTDGDRIDGARAEWAAERPDLDTSPMEVIGRILRAAHLADALIRNALRREGLDRGGFDVLATLRRGGPPYQLTPTRLYDELVLTSGAVTHRIDALERAALVERLPDRTDRRSTLVGLTANGATVIDRAMATHMQCEQAMIASLPAADRQALADLLRKLLPGIEARHRKGNDEQH
jgi:DNA-binding MarR family transcriptional regulator